MFHVKQPDKASPNDDFGMDTPLARELADLSARRRALQNITVDFDGDTRILTVSNQKGGVGKTTTAVNLASALAQLGGRVLVVDLDPQGNASTALGVTHTADTPSVYDVLIDDAPFADIVQQSPEGDTLFCAPSTIHLAGAEIELVSQVAREFRLRRALETYLREHPMDIVIIDCPPSLGLLTINAFTAASEVLIPIQCEYYALEGLSQLLGSIQMIQKHLNPELHLSTILLTMFDARTRLAQQVADEVRSHFPEQTLHTVIPRSVRVSEAPSFGQTVIAYDNSSAGAVAYREAAVEIARRGMAEQQTPQAAGLQKKER
ncbi:ParA family protein [Microbacterium sp. EF45047]|uniref:ParA family protein n=1 Tax=Microbacterium sp. EF45047 TaxID=2809708 RepID=UPI00234A694D|nr:ParA family protein [Microbacterium sp. EF45047]